MILDEPTIGLDPNQIAEVRELIRQMGRSKTVILSTHILSEVEATCDRAVVLIEGQIRAQLLDVEIPEAELEESAADAKSKGDSE